MDGIVKLITEGRSHWMAATEFPPRTVSLQSSCASLVHIKNLTTVSDTGLIKNNKRKGSRFLETCNQIDVFQVSSELGDYRKLNIVHPKPTHLLENEQQAPGS